jgi:hypothetical protein
VGDLGLSQLEFERMTWGEFQCRYRGFLRKREARLQDARLIMWAAIAPHTKKKLKPEDLISLPCDRRRGPYKLMDKERYEELKKKWLSEN